ncbi:amidophosphoribosyltransferase [Mycoplasma sp. P36-A1]|uniref:amidophosphoribosyltransferase n=1 Tax=Mycoplasma sp. P36-A1 TaxID=3252900 RepID=UPI003C2E7C93
MIDIKGLNEECGVFAVSNNIDAVPFTYYGLHSLQHRGQQAAGIACITDDNTLKVVKNNGLVNDVFKNVDLEEIKSKNCIGHVRYATAGGLGVANVQPFAFHFYDEYLAVAHNGHIGNAKLLKENLERNGSVFASTSDSEIIIHLIRNQSGEFIERLVNSLIQVDGSFAYVMLHDTGIYGIRDRHGLRPLSIGQLDDESYVLSSETCAFNIIGAKYVRDVQPGEIVHIVDGKLESIMYANETSHNVCLMEYVYFSRPDSTIDGINVHAARKESGRALARHNIVDADIVVGVPDSSISAAIGYSEEAKIPYEMGLVKNRYVGRTFIQPTQAMRERGVKMKLSAVSEIVGGKRIVLIDDSIVRGTTMKRIVKMLKDANAKEVHVRIASPAIKFPCYYGVDISSFDELISNKMNVTELRDFINADSLEFLELENLEKALNITSNDHKTCKRACTACFNGKYVTSLYDALEDFNKKGCC